MKIAIVSTQVYESPRDGYGGLEEVVGTLAKELDESGHEVSLFAPTGSYQPKNGHLYSCGNPGTVDEITALKMYTASQPSTKALFGADIIHDVTWSFASYQLLDIPQFTGKIMHSGHGMHHGWSTPPPWKMMNLLGISASHAASLSKMSGRTWRFVHNGIDTSMYDYKEEKSNRLLFLSRIWPYKNPASAIEYAEEAKIPIDIVGGSFGDERPENKAYVDLVKSMCAKSQYAKFHGEVNHATKRKMLSEAKAVLLPIQAVDAGVPGSSWAEPFGLLAPQSNISGTPIIVGANGGYLETTVHGISGFLCNNKEDYMDALSRIDEISPKDCRKQGEKFTSKKMTEEYLRLYKQIISGKGW